MEIQCLLSQDEPLLLPRTNKGFALLNRSPTFLDDRNASLTIHARLLTGKRKWHGRSSISRGGGSGDWRYAHLRHIAGKIGSSRSKIEARAVGGRPRGWPRIHKLIRGVAAVERI